MTTLPLIHLTFTPLVSQTKPPSALRWHRSIIKKQRNGCAKQHYTLRKPGSSTRNHLLIPQRPLMWRDESVLVRRLRGYLHTSWSKRREVLDNISTRRPAGAASVDVYTWYTWSRPHWEDGAHLLASKEDRNVSYTQVTVTSCAETSLTKSDE